MLRYLKMDLIAACVAVASLFVMGRTAVVPVTRTGQTEADTLVPARTVSPSAGIANAMVKKVRHPFGMLANLGLASWYGTVLEGHRTASGETFHRGELTACHRTLPFGTMVRVVDVTSGKSVVVRINDRGVLSPDRIIDLSSSAAEDLGILRSGVAKVRLEILKKVETTAKTIEGGNRDEAAVPVEPVPL